MLPKTLVVVSSEERLLLTALTALTALRSRSALPMRQKSVSTILSSSANDLLWCVSQTAEPFLCDRFDRFDRFCIRKSAPSMRQKSVSSS